MDNYNRFFLNQVLQSHDTHLLSSSSFGWEVKGGKVQHYIMHFFREFILFYVNCVGTVKIHCIKTTIGRCLVTSS